MGKEPPGTLDGWPEWIKKQGGAAVDELFVLVTLVCDEDTTVVVRPPSVSVQHHQIDPGATGLRYAPQGGPSIVPTATFNVSLSVGYSKIATDTPEPTTPLSWALSKGESQQFLIQARAHGVGIYSWSLTLPMIVDGRTTTHRIDDDGQPFLTAALPEGCPSYFWAGGEWHPPAPPPLGGDAQ